MEPAGVEVHCRSLDDVDVLGAVAVASDGVIHLAFEHKEMSLGRLRDCGAGGTTRDRGVRGGVGGSDRSLVIASGPVGLQPGALATKEDVPDAGPPASGRALPERAALALADRGVRACSVHLPPTVHGDGDGGFIAVLVGIARERAASGYVGDGDNHWPAVHRLDAARPFRRRYFE